MPVCGNYLFFELPKKIVLNPKDGHRNLRFRYAHFCPHKYAPEIFAVILPIFFQKNLDKQPLFPYDRKLKRTSLNRYRETGKINIMTPQRFCGNFRYGLANAGLFFLSKAPAAENVKQTKRDVPSKCIHIQEDNHENTTRSYLQRA